MIDSHQHFFRAGAGDYPWMRGDFAPLARDFTPADLAPLLAAAGVTRTVLVQTCSSEAETRDFLALARATDFLAGVVGWIDLTAADVGNVLTALRREPGGELLVGIRHQVHDEPDPRWLLREDVQRGLRAVAEHGLVYDLLVRPRELPAALACAQRNPDLRFVVDHIAKPAIRDGTVEGWLEPMRELAAMENVACKISGLLTEADWVDWHVEHLRPYVDHALRLFGAQRCMLGSDWPVSQLVAPYGAVLDASLQCLSSLEDWERELVTDGTAERVYGLRTD